METNSIIHASAVMKASLTAALCLMIATAAAAESRPLIAGRLHPGWEAGASGRFGVGADRRTVVDMMGLPDHRVGDALWIYYQCGTPAEDSRGKGFDALVVVFRQSRVAVLRLTDAAVLRKLIAERKLNVAGPAYADLLR